MRSTKVKALSVGGRRKIYHSGDTVTEDMFPKGEFDKLIEKGFLDPVDGDDDGEIPKFDFDDDQPEARYGADIKVPPQPQLPGMTINPELKGMPQLESQEQAKPVDTDVDKPGPDESGITVAQLKKDLDARGVKYPANSKKEDLLKLWASGE